MRKWIVILCGLLAAQLLMIIGVNFADKDYGAFQPEEKLLVFDAQAIDRLRIEDNAHQVMLEKQADKWILPESKNFPADQNMVKQLLDKLAGIEKGLPVATTSGAARRFKVAEDEFERKVTLTAQNDTPVQFFVGTSPGFRKVHVRHIDENEIFAVALNTWEMSASTNDWIDKNVLSFEAEDISKLEMPDFTLYRNDGAWQVQDLNDEEKTNENAVHKLANKVSGLRIESLLGSSIGPKYQQDKPEFEMLVTKDDGEMLAYHFYKPEDEDHYALKRSDMEYFFKVTEIQLNPIKEIVREKVVQAKLEVSPDDTAENKQDEMLKESVQ